MTRFQSAVVGLGNIGLGYDYELDTGQSVLTHATAFATHPQYALAAGVDTSAHARARFESKFGRPAYGDVATMLRKHEIDIAAVATPPHTHAAMLDDLLRGRLQAVICEKPIASSVAIAEKMVRAAREARCALAVNYMRRCEPGVVELKSHIAANDVGTIYKGVVWYSKGLANNGSHFIDLLHFLVGAAHDVEVIAPGRRWGDIDPEPDVRIRFGDATIDFLALREECYSVADVELVGTMGWIGYRDSGARIEVRRAEASRLHPGYTALGQSQAIANDFSRYQWHVCEHLYRHLRTGEPLVSDGESATSTLRVVENIISQLEGKV